MPAAQISRLWELFLFRWNKPSAIQPTLVAACPFHVGADSPTTRRTVAHTLPCKVPRGIINLAAPPFCFPSQAPMAY